MLVSRSLRLSAGFAEHPRSTKTDGGRGAVGGVGVSRSRKAGEEVGRAEAHSQAQAPAQVPGPFAWVGGRGGACKQPVIL